MFSAPIYWKVKSLVASEQSILANAQEIENILAMSGENDRIPLIVSLLDEIDFRDNFKRDEHKVRISTFFISNVISDSFFLFYFAVV